MGAYDVDLNCYFFWIDLHLNGNLSRADK